MKRFLALFISLGLIMGLLSGCQTELSEKGAEAPPENTVLFKDSLGRELEVPEKIDKVAITGPMAQIAVFAIAPDELVALSSDWSEEALDFIDSKYVNLPVLGQLYGGKGDLNKEELLKTGAQVVIDVGEVKDDMVQEFDDLSSEVGIPFIHIDGSLSDMAECYRMLGLLLGKADEAEVLARYCETTYQTMTDLSETLGDDKKRVLYASGDFGSNVIAQGSFHAEVLDLLTDNVAKVDNPSSRGTGNEVDMEQILNWDPDVVLFAPDSIYQYAETDEVWRNIRAIQEGNYYEVPYGPYNWMGFPPSAQRYLGMLWLAKLLYPEQTDYDLYEECETYFSLFYHCELTEKQYRNLVNNSIFVD